MEKTPFELAEHSATLGWAGVLAICGAWDVFMPETLSEGFKRGLRAHPGLTVGAWAVTSAHLFGVLPSKIDPFKLTYNLIKGQL